MPGQPTEAPPAKRPHPATSGRRSADLSRDGARHNIPRERRQHEGAENPAVEADVAEMALDDRKGGRYRDRLEGDEADN